MGSTASGNEAQEQLTGTKVLSGSAVTHHTSPILKWWLPGDKGTAQPLLTAPYKATLQLGSCDWKELNPGATAGEAAGASSVQTPTLPHAPQVPAGGARAVQPIPLGLTSPTR